MLKSLVRVRYGYGNHIISPVLKRYFTDNNSFKSCVTELQSISHDLYHQSIILKENNDNSNSEISLQLSQKIDNIVLKLHQNDNIQENSISSNIKTQTITNKQQGEQTEYVVSQSEVDEINQEMEDLFGSPMSQTVKL